MQQINLWQPILRRERRVFSAIVMVQTLVAALLLMLLLFAWNAWQVGRLEQQLDSARAQEQALAARVSEVARGLGSRPESRELRRQVEDARRERDGKRQLAEVLTDGGAGSGTSLVETLASLARRPLPGLWLTRVSLQNRNDLLALSLEGRVREGELVPRWVQSLGREESFRGVRFRYMNLAAPEEGGPLAFQLATETPPESDK